MVAWSRGSIGATHLTVFAIAVSLFLGMFVAPAHRVDAQDGPVLLRIGTTGNLTTLNPLIVTDELDRAVVGMLYDCLQAVDENLNPVPNLAVSWWKVPVTDPAMVASGEPYGSVWEYNLTTNASWSDGQPFGPADVVYTVDLNSGSANYSSVWSYQPYAYYIRSAEIVDADTVRIHFFDRATGDPLPVAFGDQLYIPILPEHKLSSLDTSYLGFSWTGVFDGEDMPIVGTGPFIATPAIWDEFEAGQNITLLRNPAYHWADDYGLSVRFDGISLRFYADDAALDLALRSGEIDIAGFGTGEAYLALSDDVSSGMASDIEPFDGLKCTQEFSKIAFNMDPWSLGNPSRCDPAVRTALAMASNKDNVTRDCYLGLSERGTTIVSPVSESWQLQMSPSDEIRYDLVSAADVLESAGYRYPYDGAEFRVATAGSLAVVEGWVLEGTTLQFDLMVREDRPAEMQAADFLASEWASVGVDAVPRYLSEDQLFNEVYMYSYDLALFSSWSDPEPQHILFTQSNVSWNGWSDNRYYNASFEVSYRESIGALSKGPRMTFVEECQSVFYYDVGYIVLAYPYQTYAWRTDTFTGWGDWRSHPGRSLDACWGANPLFFALIPMALNSPPAGLTLSADPEAAFVGETITLTAGAYDVDMEALTFTLDFGDGTLAVMVSPEGSWEPQHVAFTHAYSENGTYDLTLWADDGSGIDGHNVSEIFPAKILVGDLLPPVSAAAHDGLEGLAGWYVSNVTVTISSSDNMSEVASTMYSVNSGDWETYTGPFVVSVQGQVTLRYYSVDSLGNIEPTRFDAFKIDASGPDTVPDHASGDVFSDSTVAFEWTCEDNISGYDRSEYSLDGSGFVSAQASELGDGARASFDGLPNGQHTLVIRSYDIAGNVAETTIDFEVDTSSHNWLAYVGIGCVATLAVLLVGTLLMRKRRTPGPGRP